MMAVWGDAICYNNGAAASLVRHVSVIWDDDANPDGNVNHIAEHGLTIEDLET